ncbi:hypothetical protein EHW99_2094 [Erwinia amylovora]|uniref:Uncharacterized protein n=2 Tax=Erwinia amylovora TaxID=552 RepID=A0A831EQG5_ERWAM|nr:hypothetical protein EaACW_1495 [Erwinia amylovora ACW56400]QJQ54796.1 hypothetical protein EHX00_2094 [Erwinia amylovora]CBA20438.1 hypothetical protein predicted by Glimmer/Critica [Erwinia amylovora CFBP1430]CCO78342.1 hypothetical protein BN432_1539 [Erwinia amylovora Ea356]CCO82131.1 hypothetical protein BN433_1554 [Erwinia amylovora Ea266]CCO85927.1 hypothetical protein BN434_1534 [Erwinia amylovora CFBP 2585]CCO89715.1 hypothetical protein BN435_1538 [Erwinia amylovora 01SFR-BO]CCO
MELNRFSQHISCRIHVKFVEREYLQPPCGRNQKTR